MTRRGGRCTAFGDEVGWPVVLKTAARRVRRQGRAPGRSSRTTPTTGWPAPSGGAPLLAEERVAFTRELAVLVARSPHGQAAV